MTEATTHQTAKTQYVEASNGITYAYRRFGNSTVNKTPLLFLIHFRGTMDAWDPLLINTIATDRPVILFDNAGVGKSSGAVADSIQAMAAHVLIFLDALKLHQVDVLGFSMGGMIAPLVYLDGPDGLVRRLVVAGSGPSVGEGVVAHVAERQQEIGRLAGQPNPGYEDGFDQLFFGPSPTSQAAGREWYRRMHERDVSTSGEERSKLVSTGYADGGAGVQAMVAAGTKFRDPALREEGSFDRLGQISILVFIGQGHDDFMIPSINSFVMQQRLPNARLKFFPDAGHGFLYQYAVEFGADVNNFLNAKL